mgnify:CR=1 FL=1
MKCWKYINMTKPIGVAPRKFIFTVSGDWGARRPVDVCSARTGVERRHFPNKLKMHFVCTNALLAK